MRTPTGGEWKKKQNALRDAYVICGEKKSVKCIKWSSGTCGHLIPSTEHHSGDIEEAVCHKLLHKLKHVFCFKHRQYSLYISTVVRQASVMFVGSVLFR